MGDKEVIKKIMDEFICSICLQYFRDPVTIDCGHSFCQTCLKRWKKFSRHFSCPECREVFQLTEYKPTLSLVNQVDIIRLVGPYILQNLKEQLMCERHQKEQKLFCLNEDTLICVSCSESQEHENHTLRPIVEAVECYKRQHWDYQDNLWKLLECLQKTLSQEMKRPLAWSVVWANNPKSPRAMLKACIPAIFEAPRKDPEEEEMEELMEQEPQELESGPELQESEAELQESEAELQESEAELQESEPELEYESESEEDEETLNGLQMLNAQELGMFQLLKKREAKEISKIFKQRKEWKAKMEQQIQELKEMITELEQIGQKSDEELLQGVTERLRRCEELLLRGWESFRPELSQFYLIMVTVFLIKFQESPQVKNCKLYEFSEEKKRSIIFMPDNASGDIHAIYTIFNSQEHQNIISQNLIYFNPEEEKVHQLLQQLS